MNDWNKGFIAGWSSGIMGAVIAIVIIVGTYIS